jgi:uncharacterized protein YjbJ (UPF0337 family)
MSNTGKRIAGAAEELGGKVEKTAGQVTGNERLQTKGTARELVGRAKQEAAKAAGRTQGAVEQIVGAAKNRLGSAIGNDRMKAGGKATQLKGEARRNLNK